MVSHKCLLFYLTQTREELRGALESEMRAFSMDKDLSGNYVVSWNHQEFEVLYECLSDELKIGNFVSKFVRLCYSISSASHCHVVLHVLSLIFPKVITT